MFCIVDMLIRCACSTDNFNDLFVCGGQYVSLCDGHIWWWYCIRYLVCSPHFRYVFWCKFGMSHHFNDENMVNFGIVHHFWIFQVYSRHGHNRTIFVFGRKTSVFVSKTHIANWINCNGSAIADQTTDQSKTYHNTVLL